MPIAWGVLTPATVSVDGEPVELTQRQRTILLLLLTEPGRRVSIDRLADALWGEDLPKNPRNAVARFVADLRRALAPYGDRVVTSDGGYLVRVEDGELDKARILTSIETARAQADGEPDRALASIAEALALVEGGTNPWLAELTGDHGLERELEALRVEVLDLYAELMLAAGRHLGLVATLEHAVEVHPHDEGLWHHLIEAFARSGRTAEALRAVHRLRSELAEVGLEPSAATAELEARIASGSAPSSTGDERPSDHANGPPGRQGDLRAVRAAADAHRVVTVVGGAGLGKSHLVAALAADLALDGAAIYLVDVASVAGEDWLIPAVASTVGIPPAVEVATPEELAQHLSPVSGVVVFDGCDRHRSGCARIVGALAAAPGITVLSTSRTALRADTEYVHRIGRLATGRPDGPRPSASAQLYIDRIGAELDDPRLAIDVIESMCTSLDGHPGAICLAASLGHQIGDHELAAELASSTETGPTDRVLEVAWTRLDSSQQSLLARLSVFRGGCTAEAAALVGAEGGTAVSDHLDDLVACGLVVRTDDRYVLDGAAARFAADRLSDRSETRTTRSRLVDWLRSLTASWGIPEIGSYAVVSELLVPEDANFTEALEFLETEGRTEELAWLAIRTTGMWINHGRSRELKRWLGPVMDDDKVSDAARSAAAACLLEADLTVGNFDMLIPWGNRSLELAGDEPHDWVPMVAGFFAMVSFLTPLELTTEEYFEMAQGVADRSDSARCNQAHVHLRRAQVAHHRRHHDEAVEQFRLGLDLVGEPGRLLLALEMGETMSLYNGGRQAEALESVARGTSVADTDEWHYQVDIVRSIVVGGTVDPHRATRDLADALRRHRPVSVWTRANEFQLAFGLLADMRGEQQLAGELLATPMTGSPFLVSMVAEHMAASRELGPDGFDLVTDELRTRKTLDADGRAELADHYELLSWWESGRRETAGPLTRGRHHDRSGQ